MGHQCEFRMRQFPHKVALFRTGLTYSMPCKMSHASIDPATRAERALPEDLIRLCVGIEDVNDLIEDLQNAVYQFRPKFLTLDGHGGSIKIEFAELRKTVLK